ncbi:MAG: ferritin family protein [Chloroflexota bacterium]
MKDELAELFDIAIYREIASQALYHVAQAKTEDPGAKARLKELEEAERQHERRLKEFKEKGLRGMSVHREDVVDLKMSQYLHAPLTLEGAGLQDTLAFAINHERQAVDFYTGMMAILQSPEARDLCKTLIQGELGHKAKLELIYDGLFYKED